MNPDLTQLDIAVIIPCYNEELSIVKVIEDFRRCLPEARIYVFDNNSRDRSRQLAESAGAIVVKEKKQGKGYVIASMLQKIDADYYVMVDGDDTYPADRVFDLLEPLLSEDADMVVGQRLTQYTENAFRPMHVIGNNIICKLINGVFNTHLVDPLSGYRCFTREIAKNLPVVASGFDVETEMTLQLLYRNYTIKEVVIPYRGRPTGSTSKLNTFRDGIIIFLKIFSIIRAYKPLTFFGSLGLFFGAIGAVTGIISLYQLLSTQNYVNLLFVVVSMISILLAPIFISIGVIIHTLNFRLLELTAILQKRTE